ncbi:MAG: hypothetical protein ACREIC_22600 [Limisphaerales bacterium]
MEEYICNRLLVVGPKRLVKKFGRSRWEKVLGAEHCEIIETTPQRIVIQFNTSEAPILEPLRLLSRRWPKLILLLDWEWEDKRLKGFIKAQAGLLTSHHLEY